MALECLVGKQTAEAHVQVPSIHSHYFAILCEECRRAVLRGSDIDGEERAHTRRRAVVTTCCSIDGLLTSSCHLITHHSKTSFKAC